MPSKLTQMRLWMRAATTDEQKLLAHRAGTTRAYLYHLGAHEDSKYKREPRPELAAAIERVTQEMHKASGGRLPVIYRTDLVQACAQCEFARRCLGAAAARADFPLVTAEKV
jgi:hypothetical protein